MPDTEFKRLQRSAWVRDGVLLLFIVVSLLVNQLKANHDTKLNSHQRAVAMQHRREADLYSWDLIKSLGGHTTLSEPTPYNEPSDPVDDQTK